MTSFSFHAHVAAEAIEKVGRLFNASIDDILNELLQNARRAGAAKVLIDQVEDPRFGPAIRIADDGAGLDDPRSLFSLGRSEWSKALSLSEDAAGMGFFSLANRGAMIIASQKGTDQAWAIAATPDAFHGKEPITVDAGPNGHQGLTVIFPEKKGEHFASAVRRAARFFPVPVIFNGEEMPSNDFLESADHIEEWRGIRIGVFGRDVSRYHDDNANFHGVTLKIPLPELQQSWHRSYFARIDVVDCAHLKLVLPARKDVVRDAMFVALLEEITRLFFRMIAAGGAHSLRFKDYQLGRTLGIDLKEAAPLLRPYSPSCADTDRSVVLAPASVERDAFVFEGEGSLEDQTFARAIAQLDSAPALFDPHQAFAGYAWYDALRCIQIRSYRMEIDGATEENQPFDLFGAKARPDRLEVVLDVSGAEKTEWVLETDLIVQGVDHGCLDEAEILVTKQSTITPSHLITFLVDALYSPSDDAEAGSYEEQEQWFSDEAEDLSIALLETAHAADLNAIVRVVERELIWRVPREDAILIRIEHRKISVEGLSPPVGVSSAPRATT
ncbi:hypothetical protein PX860_27400 (plasmid) [Agrobacterium leguminum]|uniref:hypothetical protein n=1 Tax=Agrobacterium leguminum TaxID=2792015 RepID=UPI00272D4052|nr:hypothetical protein [Agrobacterium leguminum]WLE00859.1 hypothetical protein PX860_27400 [Agrobacterium leguminum]